jgi:hypothetical protein
VKWVPALLCGYELGAIATGRFPTLTALSAKHKWLGPVLVGALAVHLWHGHRIFGDCPRCPVSLS